MKSSPIRSALLMLLAATSVAVLPISVASAEEYNAEGRYTRIKPARPLGQTDKVEVVDVFWYGCPHCYRFLPLLDEWAARQPDYVEFKRLPAIFADSWAPHARAYYTARVLGVDDEMHLPVFNAIHAKNRPLNTREELREFFAEHGVKGEDFDATYDSFAVENMARESQVMPRRWGVQGTPSVIVNGRYVISGSLAGSYENMIKVLDVLVEREHKAMAARQQGS